MERPTVLIIIFFELSTSRPPPPLLAAFIERWLFRKDLEGGGVDTGRKKKKDQKRARNVRVSKECKAGVPRQNFLSIFTLKTKTTLSY